MRGDATAEFHRDDDGRTYVVITDADPELWISPDLWAEIEQPSQPAPQGGFVLDADVVTFGTEGEGLGVLRYRVTSELTQHGYRVLRQIAA